MLSVYDVLSPLLGTVECAKVRNSGSWPQGAYICEAVRKIGRDMIKCKKTKEGEVDFAWKDGDGFLAWLASHSSTCCRGNVFMALPLPAPADLTSESVA